MLAQSVSRNHHKTKQPRKGKTFPKWRSRLVLVFFKLLTNRIFVFNLEFGWFIQGLHLTTI